MRTQVERIVQRVKRVLSFERFYGRGKKVLQGFIDRYVTVFNVIAYAVLGRDCFISSNRAGATRGLSEIGSEDGKTGPPAADNRRHEEGKKTVWLMAGLET